MSYRIWEIEYAGSPKVLWRGPKPTPEQLVIADRLGIQVSPDDTFGAVASAQFWKGSPMRLAALPVSCRNANGSWRMSWRST